MPTISFWISEFSLLHADYIRANTSFFVSPNATTPGLVESSLCVGSCKQRLVPLNTSLTYARLAVNNGSETCSFRQNLTIFARGSPSKPPSCVFSNVGMSGMGAVCECMGVHACMHV